MSRSSPPRLSFEDRSRTSRASSRLAERRLCLDSGQLIEIRGAQGFEVECHEGAVWITQSNDPLDVVLIADESLVLKNAGLTIVSACGGPAAFAIKGERPGQLGVPPDRRSCGSAECIV